MEDETDYVKKKDMVIQTLNKADHFVGDLNAPVKLLVYEDYECEYCEKAFWELKTLREHFKERTCIIYRHFPFIRIHPSAWLAALIVEACALQQKFIQAHDLIFECQEFLEYGLGGIVRLLQKNYSVSLEQLNEDLQKETLKRKVNKDVECGMQCGVKNTPCIFINGCKYAGSVEFNYMVKMIEQILLKESNGMKG